VRLGETKRAGFSSTWQLNIAPRFVRPRPPTDLGDLIESDCTRAASNRWSKRPLLNISTPSQNLEMPVWAAGAAVGVTHRCLTACGWAIASHVSNLAPCTPGPQFGGSYIQLQEWSTALVQRAEASSRALSSQRPAYQTQVNTCYSCDARARVVTAELERAADVSRETL